MSVGGVHINVRIQVLKFEDSRPTLLVQRWDYGIKNLHPEMLQKDIGVRVPDV